MKLYLVGCLLALVAGCSTAATTPLSPFQSAVLECQMLAEQACGRLSAGCINRTTRKCLSIAGWRQQGERFVKSCEPER